MKNLILLSLAKLLLAKEKWQVRQYVAEFTHANAANEWARIFSLF
ncbi:hypothetical protein [Thalassotalea euphylliae]|nr:hypothetical protein [Thalassotalea euphylliae]